MKTISPEALLVANKFLESNSIELTSSDLGIPQEKVVKLLDTIHVKSYMNTVLVESGYNNRNKLQDIVDQMIDSKLEQAEESGILTKKDLAELIKLSHDIKIAEGRLLNDRLKIEQAYVLAVSKMNQSDDHTKAKLEAADKRLELRLAHDDKMKAVEHTNYEKLLDRLLEPKLVEIVAEQ